MDVVRGGGPAVERCDAVEAFVGAHVIFGFDPAPEPGVERFEAFEIVLGEQGQKLHAHGAKPTFLFSFCPEAGRGERG